MCLEHVTTRVGQSDRTRVQDSLLERPTPACTNHAAFEAGHVLQRRAVRWILGRPRPIELTDGADGRRGLPLVTREDLRERQR